MTNISKVIYLFIQLASLAIVFAILNKRDNPSYKMMWVIFILATPLVGGVLFFLWGNGKVKPLLKKRMAQQKKLNKTYLWQDPQVVTDLHFEDVDHARQSQFLFNESGYPVYTDTTVEYLSPGEKFLPRIDFDSYEDFKANYKVNIPDGFNFAYDVVDAIAENSENKITFAEAESITWLVYSAEGAAKADVSLYGKKVMDSVTDMAFEGYVSCADGWLPVEEANKVTVATEGKIGFGFDKEVTVEKIVVVGVDNTLPTTATLTTADNKKVEIAGTKAGNDVVFEIEATYSFGFYLDFGKEVTFAAIQAYGDDTFKGSEVPLLYFPQ